jgi:hypothetical protein
MTGGIFDGPDGGGEDCGTDDNDAVAGWRSAAEVPRLVLRFRRPVRGRRERHRQVLYFVMYDSFVVLADDVDTEFLDIS